MALLMNMLLGVGKKINQIKKIGKLRDLCQVFNR